jgi:surface antigen
VLEQSAQTQRRLYKKLNRRVAGTKRARRRFVRYGLVFANLLLLIAVAGFVAYTSRSTSASSGENVALAVRTTDKSVVGPLDQISSVDIAVNVARVVNLPEAIAVTNQSDSAKVMGAIAPADATVVAKPQIVNLDLKSGADIVKYMTQPGDTISKIASKFGITSDSIRWSNDLSAGNEIRSGVTLLIPPVNGIVYTVKVGDTPESIAKKFSANKAQLIAFNDAEISGFQASQRIVIPDGQQPATIAAPVYNFFAASYGYNGYDPGWCTWYVASKINIPTNWGNANTWDDRARVTPGWVVSQTPRVGAIAQSNYGWAGHVGIVEEVSADGSMIKYSDMNGLAGFNRVGYSGWVPTIGKYQNYIYRP